MKIIETSIPDVLLLEPTVHGDARGYFMETFRESWFRENGIGARFVQSNQSRSVQGTLRGLHYQLKQPQGKLVRVVSGTRSRFLALLQSFIQFFVQFLLFLKKRPN